jgi:hypothetical protein
MDDVEKQLDGMEGRFYELTGKQERPHVDIKPGLLGKLAGKADRRIFAKLYAPAGRRPEVAIVGEIAVVHHDEAIADDANTARPHPHTIAIYLVYWIFHNNILIQPRIGKPCLRPPKRLSEGEAGQSARSTYFRYIF